MLWIYPKPSFANLRYDNQHIFSYKGDEKLLKTKILFKKHNFFRCFKNYYDDSENKIYKQEEVNWCLQKCSLFIYIS